MLDEIIPGEIYRREDGAELLAFLDGGERNNCIAFKEIGKGNSDGTYRWMKSGVRPLTVPKGWDQNPIAGTVPDHESRTQNGYKVGLAYVECVSKPKFQPTQLELF